jgi:hypothetical protein
MNLDQIFGKLWEIYTEQNPSVKGVYNLFTGNGEAVVNDHIAFRTFNDPRVNIDVLSRKFIKEGYVEKGQYHFEEKKLFAKHFENEKVAGMPRVFISELLIEHFSRDLQQTVKEMIDFIPEDILRSEELIYSGNQWGTPSFARYNQLKAESEYAAWLYVFGFCANHFTVSVNALKKYDSLQKVNQLLKDNGFLLNDSGGEIKGNPGELLEQSSIKSGLVKITFKEGEKEVPGCYYEFARRYPDKDGNLFSGFIAKSADKIFESTNFYKKPE